MSAARKIMLSFFVSGVPKPKGSLRAIPTRKRGGRIGVNVFEDNRGTREWRELVAIEARSAAHFQGWQARETAVSVILTFFMPRPKSARLRVTAHTKPDIDKLVRCVLDAMQDTRCVFDDDARVVSLSALKRYALDEHGLTGVGVSVLDFDASTAAEVAKGFQDAAHDSSLQPIKRSGGEQ